MGRTHALTGWCAGLAVAPLLEVETVAQAVVVATVTAGAALLPDLDHPGARASRLLGPVTGLLSRGLRAGSAALYRATKGPRDENVTGTHRHGTHTLVFAVLAGTGTAVGTALGGRWGVLGVLVVGTLLAVDALGDWLLPVAGLAGTAWLGTAGGDALGELGGVSGWLGIGVALGCFVHCLGDSLTLSGCPFLWPLPIAGETWFEIRPPRVLRFRTGGAVEQMLVFPVFVVVGVLLLPGVWPIASGVVAAM